MLISSPVPLKCIIRLFFSFSLRYCKMPIIFRLDLGNGYRFLYRAMTRQFQHKTNYCVISDLNYQVVSCSLQNSLKWYRCILYVAVFCMVAVFSCVAIITVKPYMYNKRSQSIKCRISNGKHLCDCSTTFLLLVQD